MKETLQYPLIRRKMKAAERVYIYIVYTEMGCAILTKAKRRRSILVRSAVSEGGPKKPPKGIPVKLLVFA